MSSCSQRTPYRVFLWVRWVRDSRYLCWRINKFVEMMKFEWKIIPYCFCLPHKSNWVVSGALLQVSSQSNGAAQPFVAIRRFHCILKKQKIADYWFSVALEPYNKFRGIFLTGFHTQRISSLCDSMFNGKA